MGTSALTDWNEVELFLAVAESGSFSRAAAQLGIDQTTVSRRFAALERKAGVPLVVRRTTGTQLTPAGEHLAGLASGAATAVAAFQRSLRLVRTTLNPVTVAAPEGITSYLLGPSFTSAGAIDLPLWIPPKIDSSPPLQFVPLGAPADVEFIIGQPGEFLPISPEMRVRRLGSMKFVPVASRAYLTANGAPSSFQEIGRHRLLDHSLYRIHTGLKAWTNVTQDSAEKAIITAPTSSALHRAVVANAGIALLPNFSPVLDPQVLSVPCAYPDMAVDVWIGAHPDALRNSAVRSVYDMTAEMFLKSPWFSN